MAPDAFPFAFAVDFVSQVVDARWNVSGLAIDDSDNVWVSGSTYASLAEFSPTGAALSPVTGTTTQAGWVPTLVSASHLVRNLSFDASGNLWLADSSTPSV